MSRAKLFGYAVNAEKFPYFLYEDDCRMKVYSKFIRDSLYGDNECSWFALYQDDYIIGIFATSNIDDSLTLRFLEISKYKKGMGYGTYVIEHLKKTNQVILVKPRNDLVKDFYLKNGFKLNDDNMVWQNT